MKLAIVRAKEIKNKEIWRVLKNEGFVYVPKGLMVKVIYGDIKAYIEYLKSTISNYGEFEITIIDLELKDVIGEG